MANVSTESPPFRPCRRCGALVAGAERFCGVCGTPTDEEVRARGRGQALLIGSALCLLLIFAAVAWIYFSAPERRQEHAVSHLANGTPYGLAILPGDPGTVASLSGGLASASADRGASWQRIPLDGTAAVVAAGGDATFYLGGSRLWRAGAGQILALPGALPGADLRALAVDPLDSRRVYAAIGGRGLYLSQDGGATWSQLGADLPTDATSLAVTGGAGGFLFLGTAGHGVFASVGGQGWSNASGFVNGALPTHAVAAVAFDPKSGDQYVGPNGDQMTGALYAGTDLGIFKSIDGGRSWSALPFRHPVQALAVDPTGSHLMLAVDANGDVYRSTDGGNGWQ
jgi:hypothetical protein